MSKAIINKHIDSSVELSKELFVEGEIAKGEIIINNDANNPSIYILNTNDEVVQIAGGGSAGGGSYDDTAIRLQINEQGEKITEIDTKLEEQGVILAEQANTVSEVETKMAEQVEIISEQAAKVDGFSETLTAATTEIESLKIGVAENKTAIATFSSSIDEATNKANTALNLVQTTDTKVNQVVNNITILNGDETVEGSIKQQITGLKTIVDEYTVNDLKISENPVLTANNVPVGDEYKTNGISEEPIIPTDFLTTALAKLEVTLANTTLALTAAINDLDERIERNVIHTILFNKTGGTLSDKDFAIINNEQKEPKFIFAAVLNPETSNGSVMMGKVVPNTDNTFTLTCFDCIAIDNSFVVQNEIFTIYEDKTYVRTSFNPV